MPSRSVLFLLVLILGTSGCNGFRRLDEAVFHETPQYTLKVVRYYRNLFLSYNGEVFSIQCRSAATEEYLAKPDQDQGWRRIQTGGAIGTDSAEDVVKYWREYFIFLDDQTFAMTHRGLSVTFDACANITGWYPTLVPLEMVNQIEKPSYCAPQGEADCRHYDFQDARAAKIEKLTISPDGDMTFLARTEAFKGGVLRITSTDRGKTWSADPVN